MRGGGITTTHYYYALLLLCITTTMHALLLLCITTTCIILLRLLLGRLLLGHRVADMAAHEYFTKQTSHLLSGHLVVVKQGLGGAISLVIVGGRRFPGDDARECTLLVRASL